jgi:KUP system potassium uptake protein
MEPPVYRAPGTAVFLNSNHDTTPLALRDNVDYNHVLHQSVIIVFMRTLNVPHVSLAERLVVDDLGYRDDGITHLTATFGYQDRRHVPDVLALAARPGLERAIDVERASYFLSRITIVPSSSPAMRAWRKKLFIAMSRNEADMTAYFGLPDERTVTMGSLIEL